MRWSAGLASLIVGCVGGDPVTTTPPTVGTDAGPDTSAPGPAATGVDSASPAKKRAFATSTTTVAKFPDEGGIALADALCKARADNATLGGTFVAWLSDSTTNAIGRLPDTAYYLV